MKFLKRITRRVFENQHSPARGGRRHENCRLRIQPTLDQLEARTLLTTFIEQELIIPVYSTDEPIVLTGSVEHNEDPVGLETTLPVFVTVPTGSRLPIANPCTPASTVTCFSPNEVLVLETVPSGTSTYPWGSESGYAALTPLNGTDTTTARFVEFERLARTIANSLDDVAVSRYGVNIKFPLSSNISPSSDPANASFFTNISKTKSLSGQLAASLQGLWADPNRNGAEAVLTQVSRDLGQTISTFYDLRRVPADQPVRLSSSAIGQLNQDVINVWRPITDGLVSAGDAVDWYLDYLKSTTTKVNGQPSDFLKKLTPALERFAAVAKAVGIVNAAQDAKTLIDFGGSFANDPRPMTPAEATAALNLATQPLAGISPSVRAVLIADSLLSLVPQYQSAKAALLSQHNELSLPNPTTPVPPSDSSGPIRLGNLSFDVAVNHPPQVVENFDYPREVELGRPLAFRPRGAFLDPDSDRLELRVSVTKPPRLGVVKFSATQQRWVYVPKPELIEAVPHLILRVPGVTANPFAFDTFEMSAIDRSSADHEPLAAARQFTLRIEWTEAQLQDSRNRTMPGEIANDVLLDVEIVESNAPTGVPTLPSELPQPPAASADVNLRSVSIDVLQEPTFAGYQSTVQFVIQNTGRDAATWFDVSFYLSADLYISPSDHLLGTYCVEGLPGNSSTATLTAYLPLPPLDHDFWRGDGDYAIGVMIDPRYEVGETNESDNSGAGGENVAFDVVRIQNTMQPNRPDLAGKLHLEKTVPMRAGSGDWVGVSLSNLGEGQVLGIGEGHPGFKAGVYLSHDAAIDPRVDRRLGGFAWITTMPSAGDFYRMHPLNVNVPIALPTSGDSFWHGNGQYFLGAYLDEEFIVAESRESNNASVVPVNIVVHEPSIVPQLSLVRTPVRITEGNSGTTSAVFEVQMSPPIRPCVSP